MNLIRQIILNYYLIFQILHKDFKCEVWTFFRKWMSLKKWKKRRLLLLLLLILISCLNKLGKFSKTLFRPAGTWSELPWQQGWVRISLLQIDIDSCSIIGRDAEVVRKGETKPLCRGKRKIQSTLSTSIADSKESPSAYLLPQGLTDDSST